MNNMLIVAIRHIRDCVFKYICSFHTKNNIICYMPCRYAYKCDISCKIVINNHFRIVSNKIQSYHNFFLTFSQVICRY